MDEDFVLGDLTTTHARDILNTPKAKEYEKRQDENYGHCKIFAYLHSKKKGMDRLFDPADPLYVKDDK